MTKLDELRSKLRRGEAVLKPLEQNVEVVMSARCPASEGFAPGKLATVQRCGIESPIVDEVDGNFICECPKHGRFNMNQDNVATKKWVLDMGEAMRKAPSGPMFDEETIRYLRDHGAKTGAAAPPPIVTLFTESEAGEAGAVKRVAAIKDFFEKFGAPGTAGCSVGLPSIASVSVLESKAAITLPPGVSLKVEKPINYDIAINAKVHHTPSVSEIDFAERAFRMLLDGKD
jgi:hypothetical protein